MIQRIQSLYLLLAALFSAFTLIVPTASLSVAEKVCSLNSLGCSLCGTNAIGMFIFAIASSILALVSIFVFANRKKQQKWVNTALLSNLFWYITFAVRIFSAKSENKAEFGFEVGCLFPLLAMLMLFLAKKAIKHDDDLVRAADRIR